MSAVRDRVFMPTAPQVNGRAIKKAIHFRCWAYFGGGVLFGLLVAMPLLIMDARERTQLTHERDQYRAMYRETAEQFDRMVELNHELSTINNQLVDLARRR